MGAGLCGSGFVWERVCVGAGLPANEVCAALNPFAGKPAPTGWFCAGFGLFAGKPAPTGGFFRIATVASAAAYNQTASHSG